jgi:hypothetical protein
MAKHHDERRIQHLNRIFQAYHDIVIGEIARDAADERVASGRIETVFRRDPGIGAAQHRSKRILSGAQRLAFMLEVVSSADAVDVARMPFIRRSSAASDERTFSGLAGFAGAAWAISDCWANANAAAAPAASLKTSRRPIGMRGRSDAKFTHTFLPVMF